MAGGALTGQARGGDATLLLCSGVGEGVTLGRAAAEILRGAGRLPGQGWTFADLPEKLKGVGHIVWLITRPTGREVRDGEANAKNAVVAAYARACGIQVDLLWSRSWRNDREKERRILDAMGRDFAFATPDELVACLEALVSLPAPASADPLAVWRRHLLLAHRKLLPVLRELSDRMLQQVCVELEIGVEGPSRKDVGAAARRLGLGADDEVTSDPGSMEELAPRSPGRTVEGLEALLGGQFLPSTPGGWASREAGRWAVIGDPGAGKSTLARQLCHSLAERGGDAAVPVLVPLVRWATERLDPMEFAAEELGAGVSEGLVDRLERRAGHPGGLWLVFDGLDEVAGGRLGAVRERLAALAGEPRYRHVAMVVLGRPVVLEREEQQLSGGFLRARLKPLDEGRRRELLLNLAGEEAADRVLALLADRPRLQELCGSPLMLTLVWLVHRQRPHEALPTRRGALFDRALGVLLGRGDEADRHGVLDVDVARDLLRGLAFELHGLEGESWPVDVVRQALWAVREGSGEDDERARRRNRRMKEVWGPSAQAFLDDVADNASLVGPLDGPAEPWRFLHRSLREFLAAEELAALPDDALAARMESWGTDWEAWTKEQEKAAQEDGAEALPADPDEGPERWGEVHALLAGQTRSPLTVLVPLARASRRLALRSLPDVDGLNLGDAADFVLGMEPERWLFVLRQAPEQPDGTLLLRLLRSRGTRPDDAWAALGPRVTPERSAEHLGMFWFVLAEAGVELDPCSFFTAAGRWPAGGPKAPPCVDVQAGVFVMGSADDTGYPDEHPRHEVTLTRPFRLGASPVTVADYAAFDDGRPGAHPDHPVTGVTYWEAVAYCAWLGGRLPTEAEWEYACRAGTETAYWSGDDEASLSRVGWYRGNCERTLQPVAQRPANPWGLHDMHGLVWEWCQDGWLREYTDAPQTDPVGPSTASFRVLRGGSFWLVAVFARAAFRSWRHPSGRGDVLGFRLLLPQPEPWSMDS